MPRLWCSSASDRYKELIGTSRASKDRSPAQINQNRSTWLCLRGSTLAYKFAQNTCPRVSISWKETVYLTKISIFMNFKYSLNLACDENGNYLQSKNENIYFLLKEALVNLLFTSAYYLHLCLLSLSTKQIENFWQSSTTYCV